MPAKRNEHRDERHRRPDPRHRRAPVQVRGFNGFSYADVAAELNITTAGLHYHFPGKAELGRGADRALRGPLRRRPGRRSTMDVADAPAKLDAYAGLYADVLRGPAYVPVRHARRRVPDAARPDARRGDRASSTPTRRGSRRSSPTAGAQERSSVDRQRGRRGAPHRQRARGSDADPRSPTRCRALRHRRRGRLAGDASQSADVRPPRAADRAAET